MTVEIYSDHKYFIFHNPVFVKRHFSKSYSDDKQSVNIRDKDGNPHEVTGKYLKIKITHEAK